MGVFKEIKEMFGVTKYVCWGMLRLAIDPKGFDPVTYFEKNRETGKLLGRVNS